MTSDDPRAAEPSADQASEPSADPASDPAADQASDPAADPRPTPPTRGPAEGQQRPVPAEGGQSPVPDEAALAAVATPAAVRRAPRLGAFLRTGVVVGAVLGWVLAMSFSGTTGEGRTGAVLITTVAGAGFGALLAAGSAALADRRSARRADRHRPL